MQLSEAIRLGALLKPQAFHGPPAYLNLKDAAKTCALAAAAEAVGDTYLDIFRWRTDQRWPFMEEETRCPECLSITYPVVTMITHLNDFHQWTRERIAAWVATFEPAEVADAVHEARDQPELTPRV
jgi:hypothetical protein